MKSSSAVLARTLPFLVLALFPFLAACPPGDISTGTAGTGGSGGTMPINCGGAAGTSALANWAAVRSIVDGTTGGQVSCQGADCHTTGDRQPYMIGLTGPLSDDDLYTTLTTFVAPRCGNRVMVKPCDPDGSAFWRAQAGMCEGLPPMVPLPRMPFGCRPEYDQCTSPDQLDGIRQWIATGASR